MVFSILLVLSEVIGLIGRAFSKTSTQIKVEKTRGIFSELAYFQRRTERDVAIITAIMNDLGHKGSLKIKRVR